MIVLSSAWFISYVTDLLTCAFLILVCFPHLVIFPKPGSRQWTSAVNTSEQIIQCAQRQKETQRTSEREQWKIEDDANNTARIYSSVCMCVCPESCKDKEGTLDARTDWLTTSLSSVMCVCLCEGGKAATTYPDSLSPEVRKKVLKLEWERKKVIKKKKQRLDYKNSLFFSFWGRWFNFGVKIWKDAEEAGNEGVDFHRGVLWILNPRTGGVRPK